MNWLSSRLRYSNVMSTLAVFIALGGASYAATQLPKNSVGTKQIKKNAVTGAKVKDDSLTGKDIKESTLGTVPSAANATNATNAANAGHASNADSATNAGHAGSADNATHAANADNATHATTADVANAPGTLASGQSEVGVYGASEYQAPTQDFTAAISFASPLASAPTVHFIVHGTTPPAQCPGTVASPQASPGHLCIYEQTGSGATAIMVNPTDNSNTASRFGIDILFLGSASDSWSRGTWAVTAA